MGEPAHTGVNYGGKTSNLGAAPHDWGFAKNSYLYILFRASSYLVRQSFDKKKEVKTCTKGVTAATHGACCWA
jgi:hypothetical protein